MPETNILRDPCFVSDISCARSLQIYATGGISQMKEPELRELKYFTNGHTANKWQNQDLDPHLCDSKNLSIFLLDVSLSIHLINIYLKYIYFMYLFFRYILY